MVISNVEMHSATFSVFVLLDYLTWGILGFLYMSCASNLYVGLEKCYNQSISYCLFYEIFWFDLNQVNSVHNVTYLLIISGEGDDLIKPFPFLYENLTLG